MKLIKGEYGYEIEGEPEKFDERKRESLCLHKPETEDFRTLLYIHGGGGYAPLDIRVTDFFRSLGFAIVAFDAFDLNGLDAAQLPSLSLTAKQKLTLPVAYGALEWITRQNWFDQKKFYIYGLSNGGRVALALAGNPAARAAQIIFAESPPHCCLALPTKVHTRVKLLIGRNDNFGGNAADDLTFRRKGAGPHTLKEWPELFAAKEIELKFYEGGHGLFGDPSNFAPRGIPWICGGDSAALKSDIKKWVGL